MLSRSPNHAPSVQPQRLVCRLPETSVEDWVNLFLELQRSLLGTGRLFFDRNKSSFGTVVHRDLQGLSEGPHGLDVPLNAHVA